MPINVRPAPLPGTDAFGKVPGTIDLPNPAADLSAQLPGLSTINPAIGSAIGNEIYGGITPNTQKALQDAAARFGLKSGMIGLGPTNAVGNSLALNNYFNNIAGFAEGQTNRGIGHYNETIPTISRTQTVSPEEQTRVAETNSLSLAAPNPKSAQLYAQGLLNRYLNNTRGGGGGIGSFHPAMGTGGAPGADAFGNVYNEGSPGGPGEVAFGAVGWPGGAQSGQPVGGSGIAFGGSSSPGNDQWLNDFWTNFDQGRDVGPGNAPSTRTYPDWANMNTTSGTGNTGAGTPSDFDQYLFYGG